DRGRPVSRYRRYATSARREKEQPERWSVTAGARDAVGPGGAVSRCLSGYEVREGQLRMSEAVERALSGDRILLCEAGTGIGKTFAYLVPAVLSGRKVVISTATRALQDQIVLRDLPQLERALGIDVRA